MVGHEEGCGGGGGGEGGEGGRDGRGVVVVVAASSHRRLAPFHSPKWSRSRRSR